ncbi:hypothetical protein DKX38_001089 [Salix brachista]|uniref:Uncharacterized protein n=1 Tax=Salix brachista TaxID=2182728 RepID=A0A5N5P2F2_9ROSI|nr:hypothetical protein DKX38_001089 [Salix brachista]
MLVSASAVYFLNLRGDVLMNRLYRDDVDLLLRYSIRREHSQFCVFKRNQTSKALPQCFESYKSTFSPPRNIQIDANFFAFIKWKYGGCLSDAYNANERTRSNVNVSCAFKFVIEVVNSLS